MGFYLSIFLCLQRFFCEIQKIFISYIAYFILFFATCLISICAKNLAFFARLWFALYYQLNFKAIGFIFISSINVPFPILKVMQLIKNAIESAHIQDVCFSFEKYIKPLNIPTQITIVIAAPSILVVIKTSSRVKRVYKLPGINTELWNRKKRMQNLTFCIL